METEIAIITVRPVKPLAWMVFSLFVTACTSSGGAAYDPVQTESVFRDRVVDRALSWPGGFDVRFTPDGRIIGQFPDGPVAGRWQWRDGKFCRTISIDGVARNPECLGIEMSADQVRFRRANGGYFLPYRVGAPEPDSVRGIE